MRLFAVTQLPPKPVFTERPGRARYRDRARVETMRAPVLYLCTRTRVQSERVHRVSAVAESRLNIEISVYEFSWVGLLSFSVDALASG